jgi:hypothetical protein
LPPQRRVLRGETVGGFAALIVEEVKTASSRSD